MSRITTTISIARSGPPVRLGNCRRPHLFVKRGQDALLHLVRVATGLDSMVVGEEQILVQLRKALRLAGENRTSSPQLHGVISRVLEAGRRIRSAGVLGRRPSLASHFSCKHPA